MMMMMIIMMMMASLSRFSSMSAGGRGGRTRFGGGWGVTKTVQDMIERTRRAGRINRGTAVVRPGLMVD